MRRSAQPASGFTPVRLLDVELSCPIPPIPSHDGESGRRYERSLTLVRLHGQLLGAVSIGDLGEGVSAEAHAAALLAALGPRIDEHLIADGAQALRAFDAATGVSFDAAAGGEAAIPACICARDDLLTAAPTVTIAIPTRDRATGLARTLHSILALEYPDFEIVVVDNAPRTDATYRLVEEFAANRGGGAARVRYSREDRPGISWAKNRGMAEARGEVVAFTDDDVIVDQHWLTELVRGFSAAENVACVTGMIFPFEIETASQAWIEQFGGFGKGFSRRVFDLGEHHPGMALYPYTAGVFGSGANMAFRTAVLRDLGGFDPALGAGGPAMGGEDLAICFKLVTSGHRIAYEPSALVRHGHHREYAALRRQIYGYGVGLSAYLTGTLFDQPRSLPRFLAKLPGGVRYALSDASPKNRGKQRRDDSVGTSPYPRQLTWDELRGMIYGPIAYLRARRRANELTKLSGAGSES